jgi:hypothetical protein
LSHVQLPYVKFQSRMQELSCTGESWISGKAEVFLPCCRRVRIGTGIRVVHRLDRDHRRLDSLPLKLAHGLSDETTGGIILGRRVKGSQSEYVHP